MMNSYPSDRIFNSQQTTIMDSFSCILFLQQLHLDLNMCCFINFMLKQLHFSKFNTAPLLYVDFETFGGNWHANDIKTSKMTSKSSYWHHARELSYTLCVRWHFLALVCHMEVPVWYTRIALSRPISVTCCTEKEIEPCHEKTCLCHTRTTKAQISLRIRAAWSASLLVAAWIVNIPEISSL